ncbi:uncharacterized protein LOC124394110 [Silurus meridionalis]|uniref:Uncharacterized protein n=1 Tax=Silurus meridionalis TaxID=175797 RepID=A0A8T0B484_SILME|nr:uncharacterized protein LOC124394110 [Silurus meridionalis]KAF7700345.1 hypothetical protein HF521_003303 [Silurus meridionalis]
MFLHYCTTLVGVCSDSSIVDIFLTVEGKHERIENNYLYDGTILGVFGNGEHGMWLLGIHMDFIKLTYLRIRFDGGEGKREGKRRRKGKERPERRLSLNDDVNLNLAFDPTKRGKKEKEKDYLSDEDEDSDEEYESRTYAITAAAMHKALVVCGDSKVTCGLIRRRLCANGLRRHPYTVTGSVCCVSQRGSSSQPHTTKPSNCGTETLRNSWVCLCVRLRSRCCS